jgi:hypothetical protein
MVIALTATLGAFVALGLLPVTALVSHVVGRPAAPPLIAAIRRGGCATVGR